MTFTMQNDSRPYPGIFRTFILFAIRRYTACSSFEQISGSYRETDSLLFPRDPLHCRFRQREGVNVKPDPAVVFDILKLADVEKEDVLYVGDSGVDMQTAANANVTACGITWGFRPRTELEKFNPAYIVDSAKEIEKLVSSTC